MKNLTEGSMSFLHHVQELRKYLVRTAVWFVVCVVITSGAMEPMMHFLQHPYMELVARLNGHGLGLSDQLVATSLFDVMLVNLRMCVLVALAATLPYGLWQLWNFVRPGLYAWERRAVCVFGVIGLLLFYIGLILAYLFFVPFCMANALFFAQNYAYVMVTYDNYFHILSLMVLVFAAVCEVPAVLGILSLAGIVTSQMLVKKRKILFFACVVVSAILAPPDVLSLCVVALPMYGMVETSIVMMRVLERYRKKKELLRNG